MSKVFKFDKFGSPEVMQIRQQPIAAPNAQQVQVKVSAIGLRAGLYPTPLLEWKRMGQSLSTALSMALRLSFP